MDNSHSSGDVVGTKVVCRGHGGVVDVRRGTHVYREGMSWGTCMS